jgi:hypothetical protein
MPLPETSAQQNLNRTKRAWMTTLGAVLVLLVLPIASYLTTARLIADRENQLLDDVVCFHPDRIAAEPAGRQFLAVVMMAGSLSFLFVSPGLLAMLAFRRIPSKRSTAHVWSLIVNSAALFVLFLVLRNTVGVCRSGLLAGWWSWTIVLFLLAWQSHRSPLVLGELGRRWGRSMTVGLGCILAAAVVLFPEQFLQCMTEDGTEAYELARSLRAHALPAWEMETWELGLPSKIGTVVVNPSLINSYWSCGLQTLLGDGELAIRLPYWVWWFAIFIVCCHMVRHEQTAGGHALTEGKGVVTVHASDAGFWLQSVPIGLLVLLVSVMFTFYVGYNPYMADLANPGVPDALFTLAILAAFECLRHRDKFGFALSMVLASLVLHAGPVLLVLTLAAAWVFRPVPRSDVRNWSLLSFGLLGLVAAAYLIAGASEGVLRTWVETFDVEYLSDYLAPVSRARSGALFAGYFVLGAGGIGVLGLISALRGDAWQRTVASVTLGYLCIVLLSGFKNLHYLGPLLPVPLVLTLATRRSDSHWKLCALTSCSLIVCLVLCWPAKRQTFTLNRQLGGMTTFATDSYLTAVQWGRLRDRLRDQGLLSWDCDQHTWVAYSQLDAEPENPRPFLVTTAVPRSADYELIAVRPVEGLPVVARLFVRDPKKQLGWMSTQRPLGPLERYPAILRPLADGPYSPHNNQIEEKRRLRDFW